MSHRLRGPDRRMPRAGGDYVWQTRILDGIPGAVVGGAFGGVGAVTSSGTALALGDTVDLRRHGTSARSSARRSACGAAASASSCRPRAGGSSSRSGRRSTASSSRSSSSSPSPPSLGWQRRRRLLRHRRRDVRGLDLHDRRHLGARSRWAWPAMPGSSAGSLYIGLIALALMFILMIVSTARTRSRPPSTAKARACSASPTPTRRRSTRRPPTMASTPGGSPLDFGLGTGTWLLAAVHAVLAPVPELGRHALRRGPRRGRLPEGPQRHARRPVGHDRPGRRLRAARRQDVRLGLLQRHERELHQLRLRLRHRPHRRSRSGATRRCWRRS